MELQFQQTPFSYLRCVLRKSGTQEESTEIIVPDRLPDVDRILNTDACICIREKESRQGVASVSGGIRTTLLYAADSADIPQKLEAYLPFSVRVDHSGITEESDILFSAYVSSVDTKVLNSRKVYARVTVTYCIAVYASASDSRYICEEKPDELQVKETDYSLLLPVEYAERSFTVTDGMPLPQASELLFIRAKAEITDERLAGNKAVFKGVVDCDAVFLSEDGRISTNALQLPFSQFCELQGNYDDSALLTTAVVISDCSSEMVTNPNGVEISVNLTVQCLASMPISMSLAEDAYWLNCDFAPQRKQYAFETRLDLQTQTDSVRAFSEADVREILEAHVYVGSPSVTRDGGVASVSVPSKAEVLYRDGENRLQCERIGNESVFTCDLCDDAALTPEAMLCSGVAAVPTGNGIEVRYSVCLTCDMTAQWTQSTIIGGEMSDRIDAVDRPQLIAKRVDGRQELWDIAKAYDATVERIRSINGLDNDWFADGVLLIPTERK